VRRACVAIGVDHVIGASNLPPLAAAADGAERFAGWATSQQFEAFVFTDRAGALSVSAVKQRIRAISESQSYSQLVVYFAGHGILKSWDTEIWLLSDAATDPNEAVNLTGSYSLARQSGIPHVIFISDACRSIAADARLAQITGSILFPILPVTAQRPEIDLFYATLPGNPSYEVPADQSAANYRGVFTTCLLHGLSGPDQSVCEIIDEQNQKLCVVSARTLKPWLEREVPESLQTVSIALNQVPELRVESQRPKYLAVLPVAPPPLPLVFRAPLSAPTPSSGKTLRSLANQYQLGEFFAPQMEIRSVAPPARDARTAAFEADVQRLVTVQGRESFETHTGFTFVGTQILDALLEGDPYGCDVFEENRAMHVRVRMGNSSGSVVVRFADGTGTCLIALTGYVGTVTVEDGRVVNVSYTPARNTPRWDAYVYQQDEVEKRRAFVAVAARSGLLKIEKDRAASFADYVRQLKILDPTLGIYAAYAYSQAGMIDEVESVFDWMASDYQVPVLFDVALLANRLGNQTGVRIGGRTPMLTQGWALLNEGLPVPKELLQASNYTLPALWTTLSAEGVAFLSNMLMPPQSTVLSGVAG
jgi:hypothetical protein